MIPPTPCMAEICLLRAQIDQLVGRVNELERELSLVAMMNNMNLDGTPNRGRLQLESILRGKVESPFSPARAFEDRLSDSLPRPLSETMYGMSVRHYNRIPTPGYGIGYTLVLKPRLAHPSTPSPGFGSARPQSK